MPTAFVTGASRGVGRGIAASLVEAGYHVYATGRTIESANLPPSVVRIRCDHTNDSDTAAAFERFISDQIELNILVNSAWGGYEAMIEDGRFTWQDPFWLQPLHRWTSMMDASVRAAFVASSYAAQLMTRQKKGLIVNIGYWAAQKYLGNTIYGVAKAATDKMTSDMAHELRDYNVAAISLYPGLVRTESVVAAAQQGWLDISNSESPEFIGRVIAALNRDQNLMAWSGEKIVAAKAAFELGVKDVDDKQPIPLTIDNA